MTDFIVIGIMLVFCVATVGYLEMCDRLGR